MPVTKKKKEEIQTKIDSEEGLFYKPGMYKEKIKVISIDGDFAILETADKFRTTKNPPVTKIPLSKF